MVKDDCYYQAKEKYDIFPSAYASGFIAKCRKKKGIVINNSDLKRWYKEEWKDEKNNPCGSSLNKKIKKCRPTVRVNEKTPVTWGELKPSQKKKIVEEKVKVGMGKKTSSIKKIVKVGTGKKSIKKIVKVGSGKKSIKKKKK
jgi:hypothetical protein